MKFLGILILTLAISSTLARPSLFESIKKIAKGIGNSAKQVMGWNGGNDDDKPSFCRDLDCPEYRSVEKFVVNGDKIEERCYPQTNWIQTGMQTSSRKSIRFGNMFRKLFNYIQGDNDKDMKIEMTAPVLMEVRKTDTTVSMNMNFFVPPSEAATLPAPKNKDVSFATQDAMCVYVLTYGGWQMSYNNKLLNKVKTLKNDLDKKAKTYDNEVFFFAGYDSPWKLFGRRNEVMVLKKTKQPNEPDVSMKV